MPRLRAVRMESTLIPVVIVALVSLGQISRVASECATFPALFNFGDSTSDTGGIQAAFPTFSQAEFAPYGMTFPGKPFLRYSDGRLGVDFLSEALGIPYLSPYFQSVGSNYTYGVNFATAGATSQAVTYISPFSLNVQLNQFREFKQRVLASNGTRNLNALPSPSVFSRAIYYVDIGGNDFSYGYTRNMTFDQVKGYIHQVVDGIIFLVKGVYAEGGKTFIISDVGPQGCVPYFLTNFPNLAVTYDSAGCAREFNAVTQYYNGLLRKASRLMRAAFTGTTIVYLNSYDIKYALTLNAASYGFQYATRACCGTGGDYNYNFGVQCGESKIVNGKSVVSTTCKDPSQYLNWDGVHYTEAANRIITRQILSGNYFDPKLPLDTLCSLNTI
ncbi:GDSL esterase/lipase At3g26430 [Selaginella moellendorffii]|uniref:GDSL esterase/lipase At3g26430 n=1 Tax=Selaginella moellendorffii TaxID=88036 RepID=UPI000D1C2356|nr:GDSL esterase/lipase At3g26430 [Selaginella moellendorffii]XP_024531380.1 GDSL esterase/lipase At3g26430 [Selaginella moellendorffii]|eukprot:XP_024531379.1 GDSL esterase/lipase At3g26430 [Selaginella moellendorffii]